MIIPVINKLNEFIKGGIRGYLIQRLSYSRPKKNLKKEEND